MSRPSVEHFLSDARGIYLPRDFARIVHRHMITGVSDENWAILEAGPDHEWYWEAWDEVCQGAVLTTPEGVRYTLYQDGDLFMIPIGMEWSDNHSDAPLGGYVWPDECMEDQS